MISALPDCASVAGAAEVATIAETSMAANSAIAASSNTPSLPPLRVSMTSIVPGDATVPPQPNDADGGSRSVRTRQNWVLSKSDFDTLFRIIRKKGVHLISKPSELWEEFLVTDAGRNLPEQADKSNFCQNWRNNKKKLIAQAKKWADERGDGTDWSDGSDEFELALEGLADVATWCNGWVDARLAWWVAKQCWLAEFRKEAKKEKQHLQQTLSTIRDDHLHSGLGGHMGRIFSAQREENHRHLAKEGANPGAAKAGLKSKISALRTQNERKRDAINAARDRRFLENRSSRSNQPSYRDQARSRFATPDDSASRSSRTSNSTSRSASNMSVEDVNDVKRLRRDLDEIKQMLMILIGSRSS